MATRGNYEDASALRNTGDFADRGGGFYYQGFRPDFIDRRRPPPDVVPGGDYYQRGYYDAAGYHDISRYPGTGDYIGRLGGGWHTDFLEKGSPITWNPRDDRTQFSPRMDCYEDDDNIYVIAEMPGMSKERLDLDVWGDERRKMLFIRGEIEKKEDESKYTYHQRERAPRMGIFRRHVFLPDYAQTDRIEAKLDAGILTITIPKASSGTHTGLRKKIEIRDRAGVGQEVHAKVVHA